MDWRKKQETASRSSQTVWSVFSYTPLRYAIAKEKVITLQKEFPNIRKYLMKQMAQISGVVQKQGKDTLIIQKQTIMFLSIPSDMLLSEKRRLLREKFPNVKRNTMNKWTLNWQSDGLAPTL